LSITRHTRKRPSTCPRTRHGPHLVTVSRVRVWEWRRPSSPSGWGWRPARIVGGREARTVGGGKVGAGNRRGGQTGWRYVVLRSS
jgi:hypothetical protein